MKVIILAAGQGFKLDGFNKLLISDPDDGLTILEKFVAGFGAENITVVVGYRAINVMNRFQNLNYVYNSKWSSLNNSYSLALALTDEPTLVISGDLIIDPELISALKLEARDVAVTKSTEHRTSSAINVQSNQNSVISEFYQGKTRDSEDKESVGIFYIKDKELLHRWRQNCFDNPHAFAAQNLPVNLSQDIYELCADKYQIVEIDTPNDYINLLNSKNHR